MTCVKSHRGELLQEVDITESVTVALQSHHTRLDNDAQRFQLS